MLCFKLCSGDCLFCEFSGIMAIQFYKSWKRSDRRVVVCVIRWAIVDFYAGEYVGAYMIPCFAFVLLHFEISCASSI